MKILHVYHIYPALFGGISRVMYDLTKELKKKKHKVTILTTDIILPKSSDEKIEAKTGITIIRAPIILKRITKIFKEVIPFPSFYLAKMLAKNSDIIHFHGVGFFQMKVISNYAKKYNVPYIFQAHGSLPPIIGKKKLKWLFYQFIGKKILRDASKVIALSQIEVKQYIALGVPKEKISIIPNGINTRRIKKLSKSGSFKLKFGIHEDTKIILYLGRIHREKGLDFLLKSYAVMVKEMGVKNTILVIGGPNDGYQKDTLDLIHDLKISSFVLLVGWLNEKNKINAYVDSTVVVNVESKNVFGLVPLEAAACSTPVIVGSGNEISKTVKSGHFGFSVNYGNVSELSTKMKELVENVNLAKIMGERGQKFVTKNFDWDHIITKFEKTYEEVVKGNLRPLFY